MRPSNPATSRSISFRTSHSTDFRDLPRLYLNMTACSVGCLCKTPLFLGYFWVLSSPSFPDTGTAMEIFLFPAMFEISQEGQNPLSLSNPESFAAGEEGLETIRALKFSFSPAGLTSASEGIQCFWQWKTPMNPGQKSSRVLLNWLGLHPTLLVLREVFRARTGLGLSLVRHLHCSHCTARDPAGSPGHLSPTLTSTPLIHPAGSEFVG